MPFQKNTGNPLQNIWQKPLLVFSKMSVWVATPIIVALFIGKYFDEKFGTAPWIFLGLTAIAFIFSFYGIFRETRMYLKEIELDDIRNNSTTSE